MLERFEKIIKGFDEQLKIKQEGKRHFLSILNTFRPHKRDSLELFFYANSIADAHSLKHDLRRNQLDTVEISRSNTKWLIFAISDTDPESKEFHTLVEKMSELAFANNCDFDGWGMGFHL